MCGIPGSGKSAMADSLAIEHGATVYSSDKLRKELFGDENDNTKNEELFKELHRRIKSDLERGKNAIYDATNINYKKRMAFLSEIKKYDCEKICYLVATPYEVCISRNESRERSIPNHVIDKMYKNFYIPQKYEGWDSIEIVWCDENTDKYILKPFAELKDFSQDSPHHALTLGDHLKKCADSLKYNDYHIKLAAIFHDVGKPFVKSFYNSRGEPSESAHYYNHQFVGAYEALFYLRANRIFDVDILKICNYIQWHMQLYFLNTNKSIRKFVKLVGMEFYNELMILHMADKEAH